MKNFGQWCSGWAECNECGHIWTAVWSLGAAPLVCKCGSDDTDRETGADCDIAQRHATQQVKQ